MDYGGKSKRLSLRLAWKKLTATKEEPKNISGQLSPVVRPSRPPIIHVPIYELDASECAVPSEPNHAAASSPLSPAPAAFLSEPFLVPFNLYAYNSAGNMATIDISEDQFWEIQLPSPPAVPWLCAQCRLVREAPMKVPHWDFDGMTTSIQKGCSLCTHFYRNGLRDGRYLSHVQALFLREKSYIVVKPSKCELFYVLGRFTQPHDVDPEYTLYSRRFELYCLRSTSIPKDLPIHCRDVSPHPMSASSLSLAQTWIQKCLNSHKRCKNNQDFVPTRLIDVSSLDPVLVQPSSSSRIKYVALTHCWGGKATTKTTAQNLEAHMENVPMAQLPASFRDAVVVTRKLGVDYLWIDSLCIIQDSEDDWFRESSHMKNIYENAFLTISALDAADSHTGFLHPRPSNPGVPLSPDSDGKSDLYVRNPQPTWDEVFDPAPVNTRAWTLQERLLSTRILHFSKFEMFWECCTCSTRESSIEEQDLSLGSGIWGEGEDFKRLLYNQGSMLWSPERTLPTWYRILLNYTRRSLTRNTDKMAAIAGISSFLAQISGFTYRHGLWEEDLQKGLLWGTRMRPDVPHPDGFVPSEGIPLPGPSWSWISTNRSIIYDEDLTFPTTRIIKSSYDIQLRHEEHFASSRAFMGLDQSSNILTLTGVVVPVLVKYFNQYHASIHEPFSSSVNGSSFAFASLDENVRYANLGKAHALRIQETHTLPINFDSERNINSGYTTKQIYFLLLVPNEQIVGTWKRVGVGKATLGYEQAGYDKFVEMFAAQRISRIDLA